VVERALVPELRALFVDLDPAGEGESLEAIAHWARSRSRTAVVAATDPRAAIVADRVLVLAGGRVVGDLDHPERAELAGVMELAGSG
jgi:putative ABC transport system ATP-binding protein